MSEPGLDPTRRALWKMAEAVHDARITQVILRALAPRRAVIYMLHRFHDPTLGNDGIAVDHLVSCIRTLRSRRIDLLSLRDLVEHAAAGRGLRRPAAVFTVDDGYRDFATVAAPVFEELGCPVTVFLTSGIVSDRRWFWWDRVRCILDASTRTRIPVRLGASDEIVLPSRPAERRDLAEALIEALKWVPARDRDAKIDELGVEAGVALDPTPPAPYAAMAWDEVTRLESPVCEFGPHTRTHPVLSLEPDESAAWEIEGSWRDLRERLRRPVPVFCYPNGTRASFTARDGRLVRGAGMLGAVAYEPGFVTPHHPDRQDLTALPRRTLPTKPSRAPTSVTGVLGLPIRGRA